MSLSSYTRISFRQRPWVQLHLHCGLGVKIYIINIVIWKQNIFEISVFIVSSFQQCYRQQILQLFSYLR